METTSKDLLKPHYVELIYKTSIKSKDRIKVNDPDGVYLLAKEILGDRMEHHEEVYLILLNQASKILGVALVSRGSINKTVVDIKIIFQHVILSNSSRIILFHNHPSGNCKPSKADDELTKNITQLENPLKVVPLIHSNLTPVKFSHSPFCLFLFSSYSSCPLCRVLH